MTGEKPSKGKSKKKDDATPGMKLLAAYWLLLFGGRPISMIELAEKLNCSKATVGRIMNQIATSRYAPLDEWLDDKGRKWYKLSQPIDKAPKATLGLNDIQNLLLCRDLVWHLLPEEFRDSISKAIGHATVLLPNFAQRTELKNGIAKPEVKGSIDYSKKGKVMECLLQAMQDFKICKITYTSTSGNTRIHLVAPLMFVTSGESVYIQGRLIKDGKDYPNTLALHRIDKAELTDQTYAPPASTRQHKYFGIIDGDPFKVRIAFKLSAAQYVSERQWSEDQVLEAQPDGSVILEFTATSEEEVISMVLSFGPNAILLEPNHLFDELKRQIRNMYDHYSAS